MFGWEFPPHIAGGLGTASYGLTKGLAKHGVKVMFVMPKAGGDEDQSVVKIINASDVEMMSEYSNLDEYWQNVNFMEIGSNLDPETFERTVKETIKTGEHSEHIVFRNKFQFSGKYGTNLMEEVARYAMVAGTIAAQQDFDIIHAHDWLTYSAGIVAKKVSGKPLVIHVHATEFDRSLEGKADVVLADVPCSGYGVIGRKPDIKYYASKEKEEELVRIQRAILANAASYVKPGGTLLYSTCTVNRKENGENAAWFLEQFPFEAVSLDELLPDELKSGETAKGQLQLIPGVHKTDGFFLAKFRKTEKGRA